MRYETLANSTRGKTEPTYWYTAKANVDKMPTIWLFVSFNVMNIFSGNDNFRNLQYDVRTIDASKLPRVKPRFTGDEMAKNPQLTLVDAIGNLLIADNLQVYYLQTEEYTFQKGKATLVPLICRNSHKPTHMIGAEGMVFCETCTRMLTEKEIKQLG